MKKKSNRKEAVNPALDKTYNTKVRNEFIDYDYTDKLSPEDKEYLAKFTDEYYSASKLREDDNPLHPIGEIKASHYNTKGKKHKKEYDVVKKELQDANYARNNDVQGVAFAQGRLTDEMQEFVQTTNDNIFEDYMIEMLDRKNAGNH